MKENNAVTGVTGAVTTHPGTGNTITLSKTMLLLVLPVLPVSREHREKEREGVDHC
jgi:hypothetical protein